MLGPAFPPAESFPPLNTDARALPPPASRPLLALLSAAPGLTLWKSMEERMRFWFSFSVRPVTSAPVLERDCVYMKLSPLRLTPRLSERPMEPPAPVTMPLMEPPSLITLPPAVCVRLAVCIVCARRERNGSEACVCMQEAAGPKSAQVGAPWGPCPGFTLLLRTLCCLLPNVRRVLI